MVGCQLVGVFLLNFFVIIYIGSAQAFQVRKLNKIDLMNETFVAFITLPMVTFTEFSDNQESKTLAGWIINIFLCLLLIINIILIFIDFFGIFKHYI